MTNHPITPPRELTDKWNNLPLSTEEIFVIAAQWGADQELEACVEWLGDAPVVWNNNKAMHPGSFLRAARRPKPPSLKKLALNLIQKPKGSTPDQWLCLRLEEVETVRLALEALPND